MHDDHTQPRLQVPQRVEGVARITGIGRGDIRRYEEAGLVSSSERDERGVALWADADVVRLRRVHQLIDACVITLAEMRAIMAAEDGALNVATALAVAQDEGTRRRLVAGTLADLDHARALLQARKEQIDGLEERLAGCADSVRALPVGPGGTSGRGPRRHSTR